MEGYKFVFYTGIETGLALIKLEIPDDAITIRPIDSTGEYKKKIRSNKVKFIDVVEYYNFETYYKYDDIYLCPVTNPSPYGTFVSIYNPSFTYYLGEVYESDIDLDDRYECTKGIHFFETKEDAKYWIYNQLSGYWLINQWRWLQDFISC